MGYLSGRTVEMCQTHYQKFVREADGNANKNRRQEKLDLKVKKYTEIMGRYFQAG